MSHIIVDTEIRPFTLSFAQIKRDFVTANPMRITNILIFLMAILLPTQTGARQSKPTADFKVHSF